MVLLFLLYIIYVISILITPKELFKYKIITENASFEVRNLILLVFIIFWAILVPELLQPSRIIALQDEEPEEVNENLYEDYVIVETVAEEM